MSNQKIKIMKTKLLLLLLCLVISIPAYCQSEKDRTTLEQVEVSPPEFTGIEGATRFLNGENANVSLLSQYMLNHVTYPEIDIESIREGKEIIRFTVQPDGSLTDFIVVNSVSPSIDQEVINAIKTTEGMWKPGYNNETIVPMEKEFSMVFKLTHTSSLISRAAARYKRGNKLLLVEKNPKRALRHFEQGLVYVPEDCPMLMLHGLSLYELGDKERACQDWNRIKALGGIEADGYLENYCEMKGYAEMKEIISK
jgi:hypothetical protein